MFHIDNLLIVDDEPKVTELLENIFTDQSEIKVQKTIDGKKALEFCQRTRFDLVIMDGGKFCEELRDKAGPIKRHQSLYFQVSPRMKLKMFFL